MQPKGIIWDVGGTLFVRGLTPAEFVQRAFRRTGLRPANLEPEQFHQITRGLRMAQKHWRTMEEEREGFRAAARALLEPGTADSDVGRLGEQLAQYYDTYRPVPGIFELLDELQARSIPMAVVSQWSPSLRECLEYHGLLRYFPIVVVTAEEGVLKPHPRLIHRALAQMGLQPGEVVYIGDDPVRDMLVARAEGLPTIHFSPRRDYEADCYDAAELRTRLEAFFPCA